MNDVAPLLAQEAARLLDARCAGPDRPVRTLADPAVHAGAPVADAVVVVAEPPPAEAWDRWRAAGVVAVVVPRGAARDGTAPDGTAPDGTAPDGAAPDGVAAPAHEEGPAIWWVRDPRLALARLSRRLDPRPPVALPGVHASAVVDPEARLGAGVAIGAGAVVGPGARLGDGVVVGPGTVVGAGAVVGPGTELRERVVVGDGVRIGARCRVQAGAVLGSDGFGYAAGPRGAERVHHLGTVVLGDDVEIGANACVDRGTLLDTTIGDRTKVDNLVQVAHNVHLGRDVLVAGQTGIAGSTTVGDRVVIGGAVGIGDHLTVGAGARLAGGSGVTKNVPPGEAWGGYPAQPVKRWVRERYLLGRLETLWAAFLERRRGDDR